LSVYKNVINRGLFNFNDNKSHRVKIVVTDADDNRSVLTFQVKAKSENLLAVKGSSDKNINVMPYDQVNRFSADNVSVNIPAGALYDTLDFSYKKEEGTAGMFSDLHCISDKFTPVHRAYWLSIKPSSVLAGKVSKMLIVQLGDDQKKSPVKSTWDGEHFSAEVLSFGRFYIGIDTIPPVISTNDMHRV